MADEEEPAETDNSGIIPVFTSLQDFLSSDQDIREEIRTVTRELEQCAREVLAVLQGVHQTPNDEAVKKICSKGRKMLDGAKSHYGRLIEKIPTGQYYRFCDHWRFACQRFSFLGAFVVYLESERLITRAELAEMLGVQVERASGGFHIDLDDFLTGLLLLANELKASNMTQFMLKCSLLETTTLSLRESTEESDESKEATVSAFWFSNDSHLWDIFFKVEIAELES